MAQTIAQDDIGGPKNAGPHSKGLSLHPGILAPAIAFVSAGLSKIPGWDLSGWSLMLLAGFAILAFLLNRIPDASSKWKTLPGSYLERLKITISTMRTILTIIIFSFMAIQFGTSRIIREQLPRQFSDLLAPLLKAREEPKPLILELAQPMQADNSTTMYFASIDSEDALNSIATQAFKANGKVSKPPQKIIIVTAPSLLSRLVDKTVIPSVITLSVVALLLTLVFTAVVFFLETLGGVQHEMAANSSKREAPEWLKP